MCFISICPCDVATNAGVSPVKSVRHGSLQLGARGIYHAHLGLVWLGRICHGNIARQFSHIQEPSQPDSEQLRWLEHHTERYHRHQTTAEMKRCLGVKTAGPLLDVPGEWGQTEFSSRVNVNKLFPEIYLSCATVVTTRLCVRRTAHGSERQSIPRSFHSTSASHGSGQQFPLRLPLTNVSPDVETNIVKESEFCQN